MAVLKYGSGSSEQSVEIPAGSTPEAVLESLQAVEPTLAGAKITKDGANFKANVDYGRKG